MKIFKNHLFALEEYLFVYTSLFAFIEEHIDYFAIDSSIRFIIFSQPNSVENPILISKVS